MTEFASPPHNFSWVIEGKLAAMSWPQTESNLQFIQNSNICHLVTLSPEKIPPTDVCAEITRTVIPVPEFQAPSLNQIIQFLDICTQTNKQNKAVGVHCRMGRGRTGVMAACYLVRFSNQHPERAMTSLRLSRPGSIETYSQEKAVIAYYDFLNTMST